VTIAIISNGPSVLQINEDFDKDLSITHKASVGNYSHLKIPIWTLNGGWYYHKNSVLRFHMDDPRASHVINSNNYSWRQKLFSDVCAPLILPNALEEYQGSVSYPLTEILSFFNINKERRGYFCETMNYVTALAIMWGVKEIQYYGCDYTDHESRPEERASNEYWLGQANGRGVITKLYSGSTLMKVRPDMPEHVQPGFYGYLKEHFHEHG